MKSPNVCYAPGRTSFVLTPLPYDYNHLEPFITKEIVEIHHDKHQQTYVNKLNDSISENPELFQMGLYELLKNTNILPKKIKTSVINNGGGVVNHEFYWSILGGNGILDNHLPLANAINNTFGSFEKFKEEFIKSATSLFGSGYTWLVSDSNGKLSIINTANQDSPISVCKNPILTIDVWEHAYYLQYQNRRPEYVNNFFNLINWDICNEYFINK